MLMKPIGSHLKTLSNSLLFESTVQQSVLMSGFALPNVGFKVGSHWVSEGKMHSTQMFFSPGFQHLKPPFLCSSASKNIKQYYSLGPGSWGMVSNF